MAWGLLKGSSIGSLEVCVPGMSHPAPDSRHRCTRAWHSRMPTSHSKPETAGPRTGVSKGGIFQSVKVPFSTQAYAAMTSCLCSLNSTRLAPPPGSQSYALGAASGRRTLRSVVVFPQSSDALHLVGGAVWRSPKRCGLQNAAGT